MKKGEPYLNYRMIPPWLRTVKIVCVMIMVFIIFMGLIIYPISRMDDFQTRFTAVEGTMVITGFVMIQILMLFVYRVIKYGRVLR